MKQVEASLRERVRCSSLVDWPVYPRLTHYAGVRVSAEFWATIVSGKSNSIPESRPESRLGAAFQG
jgi:hypothetical protein